MPEMSSFTLGDVTKNFDARRVPVKSIDRKKGPYPYYGASGIVDMVDNYIFDGEYLLVAEDGENLRSRKTPIAFMATGRFWVNNHAHVVQGNKYANTRYLCYTLALTDISPYLTGSTQPKLTKSSMNNIAVSLPPKSYQDEVVAILGALDDKIAVNDRIAATAETLAIAHASEQRWRSRIPLSAVVDSIRISVAPARMMEPKVAHYSLPAYDAEREPDIVSPGDIKSSKLLIDRPAVLTSKLNPSNPRMWRVEPDSEMPSLASTEFLILSPSTGLTVAEIWACCMQPSVIREASSKVTGTSNSHQRIKLAEFLALNIVSPREMRESTREAINSLCKKADCSRKENRSLKKIRDALLPKLMSGEIRIRDAERVVEDAV